MRASTTWLSAAALALAACTSCSSSSSNDTGNGSHDGGTSDSSGGVSVMQACVDFANAGCMQLQACNPFALTVGDGDETTCAQRAVLACMPTIGAPGSTLTAADVDQCAQAVAAETCEQFLDNDQPSACSYTGSLANGSACGTPAQCQSGNCRIAPLSTCGTCVARGQAGQAGPDGGAPACLSDADCAATLLCNGSGVCTGPAAMGAACSAQLPCERTLVCLASTGKCATPVAVGGPCTAVTDCDGAHGAICNTMTKVCVAIGQATTNQPCGFVSGGLTDCTSGGACSNINAMGQGMCHQPAADNAPCGPGISCLAPAVCTTTARCTLPNPSICQ